MKILVTGAAGFIGSHFFLAAVENFGPKNVLGLDSLSYASDPARLGRFSDDLIVGSIGDQALITGLVANVDLVVNFAAESHVDNSIDNPAPFFQSNLIDLITLVTECSAQGKRFHQVSTDEVFGDIPLESDRKFRPLDPYRPSSPYSASKAAADHVVAAWGRTFGLRYTISICSNNYGPGQHDEKFIPHQLLRLSNGQAPRIYGSGKNVRDWIHVEDHVSGILSILDRGEEGATYLLGGGMALSNLELAGVLSELFGAATLDFDFVTDRPGHDLKYEIDFSLTSRDLGWAPKLRDFRSDLVEIAESLGIRSTERNGRMQLSRD